MKCNSVFALCRFLLTFFLTDSFFLFKDCYDFRLRLPYHPDLAGLARILSLFSGYVYRRPFMIPEKILNFARISIKPPEKSKKNALFKINSGMILQKSCESHKNLHAHHLRKHILLFMTFNAIFLWKNSNFDCLLKFWCCMNFNIFLNLPGRAEYSGLDEVEKN